MKALVLNAKGGVGKSLTAREIVAGPLGDQVLVVEVDELNRQQIDFKNSFLDVVEVLATSVEDAIVYLKKYEHVVIDVGIENLSTAFAGMLQSRIFNYLDVVVIPVLPGRYEGEGALQVYQKLREKGVSSRVVFALNMSDAERSVALQDQHFGFFAVLQSKGLSLDDIEYVQIPYSSVFTEAQYKTMTVAEIAKSPSRLTELLNEDEEFGFTDKALRIANSEWNRLAAQQLMSEWILPAHNKIKGAIA